MIDISLGNQCLDSGIEMWGYNGRENDTAGRFSCRRNKFLAEEKVSISLL